MATSKSVAPAGSGVEGILSLLNAFGQQSTTKGTANTAPLEGVLQQLQTSPDGAKLLESIFQQASAQIPKFQAAYGNAVGARSGRNSSVQAALSELLKQTTLAGQQQLAQQTQNNQNMQVQAASSLANATRGQNTTTQPNLGLGAKVVAGLQGLNTAKGLFDKGKKLWDGVSTVESAAPTSNLMDFSYDFSNFQPVADGFSTTSVLSDGSSAFDFGNFLSEVPSFATEVGYDIGSSVAEGAADVAADSSWWDSISEWFGFADGGLVGRDGEEAGESNHTSMAERYEPHGYADGGVVKAGGGRRSSAPTYTKNPITPNLANNGGKKSGLEMSLSSGSGAFANPNPTSFAGFAAPGSLSVSPAYADNGYSDDTAEPIPNWLIGAAGSLFGINPLITMALKGANNWINRPPSEYANPDGLSENSPPENPLGLSENSPPDLDFTTSDSWTPETGTKLPPPMDSSQTRLEFDWENDADYTPAPAPSAPPPAGHANGGKVKGPGTSTSDSVPAMLSKNEYVMSADVVQKLGVDFFDNLQKQFHTPVGKAA